MTIVKVTKRGQIILPVDLRKKLGITENGYLVVEVEGEYLRLKKLSPETPLGPDDPIWSLIGKGSSGSKDVSVRHDHYLSL